MLWDSCRLSIVSQWLDIVISGHVMEGSTTLLQGRLQVCDRISMARRGLSAPVPKDMTPGLRG